MCTYIYIYIYSYTKTLLYHRYLHYAACPNMNYYGSLRIHGDFLFLIVLIQAWKDNKKTKHYSDCLPVRLFILSFSIITFSIAPSE